MRIHWSENAIKQLESCCKFLSYKNKSAASRLYNALVGAAKPLASFPQIGRVEPLLESAPEDFRALVVARHYKLIYTIGVDTVEIHAVWDCRRRPSRLKDRIKPHKPE